MKGFLAGFFFFLIFIVPGHAYAMHISEGILPFRWAFMWSLVAAPMVFYGLWRLKKGVSEFDVSFKPLVGLVAAVVFIISAMPVPVPTAGTCSHPCGTGISGILLGPGISALVAATALLLQALFMAHGGLSTLGANVLSMGVAGSVAGYLAFWGMRRAGFGLMPAGFMAGLMADWATYMATAAFLALGIKGAGQPFLPLFAKIAIAFLPTQLPLGVLEGFMTGAMVVLLSRKRPDILVRLKVLESGKAEA